MVMSVAPGCRRVKAYGTILPSLSMAARPMAREPAYIGSCHGCRCIITVGEINAASLWQLPYTNQLLCVVYRGIMGFCVQTTLRSAGAASSARLAKQLTIKLLLGLNALEQLAGRQSQRLGCIRKRHVACSIAYASS